jgi:hypothetical protein
MCERIMHRTLTTWGYDWGLIDISWRILRGALAWF